MQEENSTGTFEDFTGTTEPTIIKEESLPCLYERNEIAFDDSFVGFNNVVDGKLYFSPKQLIKTFSTFRLDARQVIFTFDGQEFVCVKVVFLEELFSTPVAVEFSLKDRLRG